MVTIVDPKGVTAKDIEQILDAVGKIYSRAIREGNFDLDGYNAMLAREKEAEATT